MDRQIVYYRKDRAWVFILAGFLHLVLFAYPNDFSLIHLPIPLLLFGFGFGSMSKVALEFSKGVLLQKAIFGPTTKSFRYEKISDFYIEGFSLYLNKKRGPMKVCSTSLLNLKKLKEVIE